MVANKIVSLTDKFDEVLEPSKPIFYTVKELRKLYSAIAQKGWTEEDLRLWVSQRILIGRNFLKKNDVLEVEKFSIELFIKYHDEMLQYYVDGLEENLDEVTKKRAQVRKGQ